MTAKHSKSRRKLPLRAEIKQLKQANWQLNCLCNKHQAHINNLERANKQLSNVAAAIGHVTLTHDLCHDINRLCIEVDKKLFSLARDPAFVQDHLVQQFRVKLKELISR